MNWFLSYAGYMMGAVVAILPIVNPLGAVPLVMTVTSHLSEEERLRQVRRACIYTFVLMVSFLVAGRRDHELLRHLDSGHADRRRHDRRVPRLRHVVPDPPAQAGDVGKREVKDDVAFTPLAMPGLSGPGTFAVVMSLSSQASTRQGWDRILDFAGVATGILLVALSCWFVAARRRNASTGCWAPPAWWR